MPSLCMDMFQGLSEMLYLDVVVGYDSIHVLFDACNWCSLIDPVVKVVDPMQQQWEESWRIVRNVGQ